MLKEVYGSSSRKLGRCFLWPHLQQRLAETTHPLLCAALGRSVVSTLCNPMDYTLPGSSIHGDSPGKNTGVDCNSLLQGIFPTRDRTQVSLIAGRFFTIWATREVFALVRAFCTCVLSHFSHVQLCDPVDCSLPYSSVHGILWARILEGVAIPSSRESSRTQRSIPRLLRLLHWQAGSLPLVSPGKPY